MSLPMRLILGLRRRRGSPRPPRRGAPPPPPTPDFSGKVTQSPQVIHVIQQTRTHLFSSWKKRCCRSIWCRVLIIILIFLHMFKPIEEHLSLGQLLEGSIERPEAQTRRIFNIAFENPRYTLSPCFYQLLRPRSVAPMGCVYSLFGSLLHVAALLDDELSFLVILFICLSQLLPFISVEHSSCTHHTSLFFVSALAFGFGLES
mmetsp:Transcript_3588/g.6691  ORF Transcript_3588/g.6691 Transcript_3588/m.6691 type:complete len:203 (-) Transcript_3588:764-1372(-)